MATAFKLNNNTLLITAEAPGGVYNSDQLTMISQVAIVHGSVVKATEDHRLTLMVPEADVAEIEEALAEVGMSIRHYQSGLHQPVSCIGALCPMHQQDSLSAAMELTEALADIQLMTPLKIGFNGCTRVCVATHTLDISVIADVAGYRISLGGKNSQIPEMAMFMAEGVPADKVVEVLHGVVKIYAELAKDEDSLQDVMERVGNQPFIDALAPYSQDAHAGADPFAEFGESDEAADNAATMLEMEEVENDVEAADEELDEDRLEDSLNLEELGVEDETEEPLLADIDPQSLEEEIAFDDDVPIGDDDLSFDEADLLVDDPQELADRMLEESQEATTSSEEQFDDESADAAEVSEDEADAFEEKLAASIEEEQSVPMTQDENSDDRLHAVEMIEASGGDASITDEFIDIDEEDFADDVASVQSETLDSDFDDEFDEEPIMARTSSSMPHFGDFRSKTSADPQWSFTGLEPLQDGRILIRFQGGAEFVIDPTAIDGNREFTFGRTEIRVTCGSQGCQIDIDGMGLFLPRAAA